MDLLRAIAPRRTAHAHCDIPCGIYDPHGAEVAARTVARMVELIGGIEGDDAASHQKFDRCVMVKEDHSESVKREVHVFF